MHVPILAALSTPFMNRILLGVSAFCLTSLASAQTPSPAAPAVPTTVPPITTAVPATKGADWTLDAFPEMVMQSLTQQNVAQPGPITQIPFGGIIPMSRPGVVASAVAGAEPTKLPDNNGISFAANSAQHLTFKGQKYALVFYRWTLVVFRVDPAGGSGKTTTLVSINDSLKPEGRSNRWMPRLEFDKSDNSVTATYCGSQPYTLKSAANSIAADGKWNVALTYRRHGRLFLRVNGQDCGESPTDSFSVEGLEDAGESRVGNLTPDNVAWALDGLWLGQSELSERVVEKMEAWALIHAATLPGGAAAQPALHPVVDDDDFPSRYTFDPERYAAWKTANPKEKRLANQGQPVDKVQPDRSGWVRVFLEDFRKPASPGARALNGSTVGDSTADQDAGKQIWYAPGTNAAVGSKAVCRDGNTRPFPEAYVSDFTAHELTMRLYSPSPGKWINSQFSSVNADGVGYSWAGPKGFRVRAKWTNVGPGLFPCPLWFYGLEHLFWNSGERVEFDIVEPEPKWENYGGTHIHNGVFKGLFGHSSYDTMKKKTAPKDVWSQKIASGLNVAGIKPYDGNYHTWEVWIEDKLTYINVDGIEVGRVDTTPEYLERLYMYINTALKEPKGMDETKSYDMVLSKVEGFQPPASVDAVPGAPFTARPSLEGTGEVGSTLTCTANVNGCSDVWYYWHSDGYPRGFSRSNTYTVLPDDKGAPIRCMVKAVGAKDEPESWTAPLLVH